MNKKQTSKRVASVASKILRDKTRDKSSKTVSGSALSQSKSSKKIGTIINLPASPSVPIK